MDHSISSCYSAVTGHGENMGFGVTRLWVWGLNLFLTFSSVASQLTSWSIRCPQSDMFFVRNVRTEGENEDWEPGREGQ